MNKNMVIFAVIAVTAVPAFFFYAIVFVVWASTTSFDGAQRGSLKTMLLVPAYVKELPILSKCSQETFYYSGADGGNLSYAGITFGTRLPEPEVLARYRDILDPQRCDHAGRMKTDFCLREYSVTSEDDAPCRLVTITVAY